MTEHPDQRLSSYDYHLPEERIAQNPAEPRDASRLLLVQGQTHEHRIFRELDELLRPGDLLVVNTTRVLPARLYGRKPTGSDVELLLLEERSADTWLSLVRPGKRLKPGAVVEIPDPQGGAPLRATIVDSDAPTGGRLVRFELPEGCDRLLHCLDRYGEVPLPPYITESTAADERYQTVYAQQPGSVAAPTAGLHFTPALLERLAARGIGRAEVTLHVGIGTFRPVESENILEHNMHAEVAELGAETVEQIKATRARGGRVIAVGTTTVRTLEGVAALHDGDLQPFAGPLNLFIYPGFRWQVIDGLITNFHLPKSSLMMLVSALIGRERLLALYDEAIREQYRFYSFGDAMLLLP